MVCAFCCIMKSRFECGPQICPILMLWCILSSARFIVKIENVFKLSLGLSYHEDCCATITLGEVELTH